MKMIIRPVLAAIPVFCSLPGILALRFPEMPDLLYSLLTQTAIFGSPAGVCGGLFWFVLFSLGSHL